MPQARSFSPPRPPSLISLTGNENRRDSQGGVSTEEGCCRDAERRHHGPLREGHAQARGQTHCARRRRRAEEGCHRRPHGASQQRSLRVRPLRSQGSTHARRHEGGEKQQKKMLGSAVSIPCLPSRQRVWGVISKWCVGRRR